MRSTNTRNRYLQQKKRRRGPIDRWQRRIDNAKPNNPLCSMLMAIGTKLQALKSKKKESK